MEIKSHKFTVDYCSVFVPVQLANNVPIEFKNVAIDEFKRLKEGIEVDCDDLYELVYNTPDFAKIPQVWREFLSEVIKINCDIYVFTN